MEQVPEKRAQRTDHIQCGFGGDALSLALYKAGDVAGGNLMKVRDASRKTLREKRAYDRRQAQNRRLG